MSSDWGKWDKYANFERPPDRPANDEAELWRKYREHGDAGARDKLILEYYGLVKYVAGRLARTLPANVGFHDLVSYGLLGLADAIDRFEPERGYRFSTFAGPRIRGSILDCLREDDWIPRIVRRRARALGDAEARLTNSLGRLPTDDEIAAEVGISLQELTEQRIEANAAILERLDDRAGSREYGGAGATRGELVSVDEPSSDLLDDAPTRTRILVTAIKDLPDRAKLIVALYYYEKMSLSQIGKVLGVSESRVSRILSSAVTAMRQRIEEEDLEDLLQ